VFAPRRTQACNDGQNVVALQKPWTKKVAFGKDHLTAYGQGFGEPAMARWWTRSTDDRLKGGHGRWLSQKALGPYKDEYEVARLCEIHRAKGAEAV